jgi:outer membrane receptor protein involved in Fe transport
MGGLSAWHTSRGSRSPRGAPVCPELPARRRRTPHDVIRLVYALVALFALFALASAEPAKVPDPRKLPDDIPPQPLFSALTVFQQMTGLSWGFGTGASADNQQSPGARRGLPLQTALNQLLRGTHLKAVPATATSYLIQLDNPKSLPAAPDSTATDVPEEIVIRGTRWENYVTQWPVDAVLWDSAAIEASGVKNIADIAEFTPAADWGFFSSVGSGVYTDLIIRGVTDRHGSTTGIFFDEVAIPAARSNTFGRALPPTFDLERVEVLRGPQGARLGADTQGGAALFIPESPSLDGFTATTRAEFAMTERGDPSYEVGGAAGGPIRKGELGFRVSAWYRTDGGYVNLVNPFDPTNCSTNCRVIDANANEVTSEAFRAALTWEPSSGWKITPAFDYTAVRSRDSPAFFTYLSDPGAGRLDNGSLIAQPFDDRFYLGTLKIKVDLPGGAELDSLSAYYRRLGDLLVDDTESQKWGGWGNPRGLEYPSSYNDAVITSAALRQDMFSQELRLLSKHDANPSWLAGLYYAHTGDTEAYRVTAQHIPANNDLPLDLANSTTTEQSQLGAFGEVRVRFLGRLTLAAGARIERERYDSQAPGPPEAFVGHSDQTMLAPSLSLFYEADSNQVYYFSTSRGYSPAGVDAALPTCYSNPLPYPADTLWSYEFGTKLRLADGEGYLNATAFDARWNNGPDVIFNCLVTHVPGGAFSRGVELDAQLLRWNLLSTLSLAYIDAHYTDTASYNGNVIVNDGDVLGTPPLVASPWTVVASLQRTLVLRGALTLTLRGEDAYHSHNGGPFYTTIFPSQFNAPNLGGDPATNILNLRATMSLPSAGRNLDVALFLNNVFDSQPTLLKRTKGIDDSTLTYATTFRPRTLGVTATCRF